MNKLKKIFIFLVTTGLFFLLAGCSNFSYAGEQLKNGVVGVEYNETIDYASGTDNEITYTLKENSTLPKGLQIESGSVVGIPEEAVTNHEFVVVASAGKSKKEAKFKITINRGQIVFNDAIVDIIIGKENSGTVNIATGAKNIKYEIIEGEDNLFDGISIAEDGTILGVYDRVRTSRVIVIKASADDVESATAQIQIRAIYEYLDYSDTTLVDARVGLNYAASVALIKNEGVVATYSLIEGSKLPEGLTLNQDGTITGIPTEVGPAVPFKVMASAPNFSNTIAEFKIDVILNHVSVAQSKIINFGKESEPTTLSAAYDGQFYVNQRGVQGGAFALNNNALKFTLVEGEGELPPGLVLYENGAIIGLPTVRGNYEFSVKASATGTTDVVRKFIIKVQGTRIRYDSQTLLLTRGEPVNINIGTADAGAGTVITYTMAEADKESLLNNWGLSVSEAGVLTGTPTKSHKIMNFQVTANAEGFTSTTAAIFVRIQEPLTEAKKFEAEYINLIGKSGTGYSGAPTEEAMITGEPIASNGYFINYLHNHDITLEFVIWSDQAVSDAVLYVGLGSELGNITLRPNEIGIYTYDSDNIKTGKKTQIQYTPFTVEGGNGNYPSFNRYKIGNISLVEGYNVIQIVIHPNTYKQGATGGPGLDFIEIETSATLKWHPCLYNIVE
ncbi:MAG: putative Ig domain-containing protein [Acholeplasmataceae bacterium]|jgi:hypothetical protein